MRTFVFNGVASLKPSPRVMMVRSRRSSGYYYKPSAAAKSPVRSSRAWSLLAFLRSYQPLLLRRRRMFVMAFISIQVGVDEDVATAGARLAERVKGAGVLISFVSCSFGKTGAGPSSSETWKSRMKVCLNHDRSRWKNAGLWPRAARGVGRSSQHRMAPVPS